MTFSRLPFRRPSKEALFVILMISAGGLLLLPREFLGPARGVTGLFALLQGPVSEATHRVSDLEIGRSAITAEEHAALLAELQARRNLSRSLTVRVADLEEQVRELTRLRSEVDFPAEARLIPADVIGKDALAARGSLLLSAGRSSRAKPGDWVTSRKFLDAGSKAGVRTDAGVIGHETLIGWVEATEAYTSRVVLLSDHLARRPVRVHIVRDEQGQPRRVVSQGGQPLNFSLEGAGGGLMKIQDVNARYVEQGFVRVGDLVMSSPQEPRLPVSLVIGEITALEKVADPKKKPLYYTAIVRHYYDPGTIHRVFIADFPRPEQASRKP
ncbi:MAG: hypothetical protein AMXMBFR83_31820 [Phycisphaerae bacterium]